MAEFHELDVFDDPHRFRDDIAELVARDPVGATMLSGVLANQITEPAPGAGPLLMCLRNTDGPFVAALRMPGFPMLVVADPAERDLPAALRTLIGGVLELGQRVVGLHGRRDVVRQLAAAWADRAGVTPEPRMWSLLYRLGELVEPGDVRGRARSLDPGEPAEIDLLAEWFARFRAETGVSRGVPVPDPDGLRRTLRRGERFTLWCLEPEPAPGAVPVSVAGHSPLRADGGCRIAPVYTPPRWRRNRFGAAVTVAAVRSARGLGAAEVTLFTDEDYRPSNDLYRSLGFEPIAEFAEFDLPEPAGPTRPAPAGSAARR
ncbi:GNAT family N-acetyltransferase [Nakamurella sp.]|uniref:GNAT family N-acetyltransferase n=1 Tax=Nakamurella sp. TaxID=1869182 RepID=UPI00378314C1